MKRYIVMCLILLISFSLFGCAGNDTKNETEEVVEKIEEDDKLTDDDDFVEGVVALALLNEIGTEFNLADPGSCRYSINKIDRSGSSVKVYGEVTLYDKYGKLSDGRGGGTPFRTFDIKMDEDGDVTSCKIQ